MLHRIIEHLAAHGCGKSIDAGWTDVDLEVFHDPWKVVKVATMQEDHGEGKRLIRLRYRQRLGGLTKAIALLGLVAAIVSLNSSVTVSVACAAGTAIWLAAVRHGGSRLLRKIASIVDELALEMGLTGCHLPPAQSPVPREESSYSPVATTRAP